MEVRGGSNKHEERRGLEMRFGKVEVVIRGVLWTRLTARAGPPRRRVQKGCRWGAIPPLDRGSAREKEVATGQKRDEGSRTRRRLDAASAVPRGSTIQDRKQEDEGGMQKKRNGYGGIVKVESRKKQDSPISIRTREGSKWKSL